MSLSAKLRRAPLRAVTGAFILNSGVGKLSADDDTAKKLHGMASGTYGFLGKMQPGAFTKGLAVGEIALGSALLLPIVPPVVAGAALVGFSGALLNTYWRTPGLHQEGDPRPTANGVPMAKDVWMFGIGTGLVADALLEPAHDKKLELTATASEKRAEKSRRAKRKAAKAAAVAAARSAQSRTTVGDAREEAAERAQHAGRAAREKAKQAGKAARNLADEYGPVVAEKAKQARDAAQHVAAQAQDRLPG